MTIEEHRDRVFDRGVHRDEADFVVIGTGPAGSTAAHVLSLAGHDVIMVEEGRTVEGREVLEGFLRHHPDRPEAPNVRRVLEGLGS